jgi:PAS domain S-box-containing protein
LTLIKQAYWPNEIHLFGQPVADLGCDVVNSRVRPNPSDFQVLLDYAPDALLICAEDGAIEHANAHAECLFGYADGALAGQAIEVLVPVRYHEKHRRHRADFAHTPSSRAMGSGRRLHGLRYDGTEFSVEISLEPVETTAGSRVIATIRDISERAQTLRTAEAQSRQLGRIFEASLNEIYLFDAQTLCFVQVNEGARRNIGYSATELHAMTPVDIKPTMTEAEFDELIRPLRAGLESKLEFQSVHRRKNGTDYPVEVHLQLMDFSPSPVYVAIIIDITERQRVERELRESHDALERRVAERTVELGAAKEAAEQGAASKARFLAAASHDLRQPLQSLGMYLGVLDRASDADARQSITAKMGQALAAMGGLLNALLDISKLDGGSVTPTPTNFSVQALFDTLAGAVTPHAQAKGLELRVVPTIITAYSDPALVERIIDNFLTNAIRYTSRGEVTLQCETTGDTVRIEVRDTGIGIPKEALARIFEEYVQLDNPGRDRTKGLGLGLAVVERIAQMLGHPLDVQSTVNEGSVFAICIPIGNTLSVATNATQNISHADETPATVLLIDDDPSIVDAMQLLLESEGMTVRTAANSEQAMAALNAGLSPDVIVSDFRLQQPETGAELLVRLRTAASRNIPAIIMTGDTSREQIEATNLPHCAVLKKPVNSEQLIEFIALARNGAPD